MLLTTLPSLRCPNCLDGTSGALTCPQILRKKGADVLFGSLLCGDCGSTYPILAGVAVVVCDVGHYLRLHAKGVSAFVADADIPPPYRDSYLQAKAQAESSEGEEDLESERVNALYYLNHYVSAAGAKDPWWRPKTDFSPVIDRLVKNFWDEGPFAKIAEWNKRTKNQAVIELGCGAGGLARVLQKSLASYLGVDTSFASIALARHVNLGGPYPLSLRVPQDLYNGALTGKTVKPAISKGKGVDFIVGEIENLPVVFGAFDLAVALNTIDVIDDPSELPQLQYDLLRKEGVAIQSSPYLWDKAVAEGLRSALPKKIKSSSAAAEYLYEQTGFTVFKNIEHVPWLFLEHYRKIGLYSVHLFAAKKT